MKNPTKEDFKYVTFVEIEFFKNHVIPPTWSIEASPFKRYYALVTNVSDYTISIVFRDDSNKLIETLIPFSALNKTLHVNVVQTYKQGARKIGDQIGEINESLSYYKPEYTPEFFKMMVERGGVNCDDELTQKVISDWNKNGHIIEVIDHAVIKAAFWNRGINICKHPIDKIVRIPSQPHTYMYNGHIDGYGYACVYMTIGDKFDKDRYQRYIDNMKGDKQK